MAKLLLACCRFNPDLDRISHLAGEIADWTGCLSLARHHLIVPKVHGCFKALTQNAIPADVLRDFSKGSREASIVSLLHQAELKQLIEAHVRPLGIGFLVVKGMSLAARYYRDITLRQARDIDVLIMPDRLHELTVRLLIHGYRLNEIRPATSTESIRAFCETNAEINLLSPRGVAIQLHKLLDFTGCQYPVSTEALIERGEFCTVGSFDCPVLPTNELFVYVSYHHGRHQWSRMHWLADLDALISDAAFDLGKVRARARDLGMERLTSSAVSLHALLFEDGKRRYPENRFTRQVEINCLGYLRESANSPEEKRRTLRTSGRGIVKAWLQAFAFNWHANTKWRNRIRYLLSLPRPTYADYLFLPLPVSLFSLYLVIRPVRIGYEIIRGKQIGAQ